jgi:endonuclease-3
MQAFDRDDWTLAGHLLIWHGRRCCYAQKPDCGHCSINELCPSAFKV